MRPCRNLRGRNRLEGPAGYRRRCFSPKRSRPVRVPVMLRRIVVNAIPRGFFPNKFMRLVFQANIVVKGVRCDGKAIIGRQYLTKRRAADFAETAGVTLYGAVGAKIWTCSRPAIHLRSSFFTNAIVLAPTLRHREQ